jgi:hypothetical protein
MIKRGGKNYVAKNDIDRAGENAFRHFALVPHRLDIHRRGSHCLRRDILPPHLNDILCASPALALPKLPPPPGRSAGQLLHLVRRKTAP